MQWDNWRLLTIVSLAGFVGLLFGQMMTFMFIASFGYALWMQRAWYQLWLWLEKPKKEKSPSADGVIDDVCRQIDQIRIQNANRKKKLAGYLKRFQAATAALPDAVVVLGDYGEVEWANTAALSLLGVHWPRDNHVRLNNLIRDPNFQNLIDAPKGASNRSAIVRSPLDPKIQLEMKIVSYMDTGRLLIARDMTSTIKLQQMRRDFVANVSHELRTPLTVLRGYLGSFTEETPPELWQMALPVMKEQSERMQAMITDLLALSQLETGEKPLRHLPIDMAYFLKSITEEAKRLSHYKQQEITLKLKSERWFLGDRDELHSAISNLVFNAVKYTPPDSKINVRWKTDDQFCYIDVRDDGEGIAEHHLERLTERFYRVDSGRAKETGGTGLGLAIVKHVLQRHDGELLIASELGKGSQFRCRFPRRRAIEEPEN
jgi:two-component system phosphate regulon sensor histidine kinase PhoR